MPILGRFEKQPGETLDYDVDFSDWFVGRSSAPVSFTVTVDDPGITVAGQSLSGFVVKVVLSGGVDGKTYKVTVRLTTSDPVPLVKEADFTVRVKAV